MSTFKSGCSALILGVVALSTFGTTTILTAPAAYADKGGNGNGNANGHDNHDRNDADNNGNNGNNGHDRNQRSQNDNGNNGNNRHVTHDDNDDDDYGEGDDALRNLNAAHASENGREHANPNSNVGQIETYRLAALETGAAQDALDATLDTYDNFLGSYNGPTSTEIEDDIAALDPDSPTYAEDLVTLTNDLDAAQAYEMGLGELLQDIDVAESNLDAAAAIESTTLLEASNGRTLTDTALAEFRSLLGL